MSESKSTDLSSITLKQGKAIKSFQTLTDAVADPSVGAYVDLATDDQRIQIGPLDV